MSGFRVVLNEQITFLRIAVFAMLMLFLLPTVLGIYFGWEDIQIRKEVGPALPNLTRISEDGQEVIQVGIAP